MSMLKQILMWLLASKVVPKMKMNFGSSDVCLFCTSMYFFFGTRILITALSSTTAIFASSLLTSLMEISSAVCVVHLSFRRVRGLEATSQKKHRRNVQLVYSTGRFHGDFGEDSEEGDATCDRRRLWVAQRQMSAEVLLVINELFIEFFGSSATVVFGMAFHDSDVLSKRLSSDLSWDMLPLFAAMTYGPELLDTFLVVIYLRRVGVD